MGCFGDHALERLKHPSTKRDERQYDTGVIQVVEDLVKLNHQAVAKLRRLRAELEQ